MATIGAPPTGLGLVRRLDPSSRILLERFDEIVRDLGNMPYARLHSRKAEMLNLVSADWDEVCGLLEP